MEERGLTYDRENGGSKEYPDAILIVPSEIPCGCEEDEEGCECSCEKQLQRNNGINFAYESPT